MAIREKGGSVEELYTALRDVVKDASAGIDRPEAVVRMVVLDCIKQFKRLTGRRPERIFIPIAVESALQVDRGRNLGMHEKEFGPYRKSELVFGLKPVWDATEFRVE